jgi:Ca2+-binding EF-hand superfamily protein/ferredoxin-NADP reductase
MPASSTDRELLRSLDRAFSDLAGRDGVIDQDDLKSALKLKSDYLARRVFSLFDHDGDGVIRRDEFLGTVRALIFGSDRDKLLFAFRLHDHDGDGSIDQQELVRMIAISLAESDAARATQPPELLARVLFSKADRNRDGRITFDELEELVRQRPALLRKMTESEASWIAPNADLLARVEGRKPARSTFVSRFLENRKRAALIIVLWLLAHLALVGGTLASAWTYANPVMVAGRALGACISFNGALILVPMMRRLMTWVRSSVLWRVIPVDRAIGFHKLLGHVLYGLAVFHSAAFVAGYAVGHPTAPVWQVLSTARGATGALLLLVFTLMWGFTLGPIRRNARFELFYFSHLLYIAWFVLAIAHAPSFLIWAGVPLFGFGTEQVLRLRRRGPPSPILNAQALRSGVTRLEIARPPGFDHHAGDYVFLRIPAIARREWHPFTISSAPERETLTVHVRSLGNWTGALRRGVQSGNAPPLAFVDGPYGTPSAHIFESRFAVLIGAGIGVTPFASVLESLVYRANGASRRASRLEKAHFIWLNRDQYSFEWFAALLADLEGRDRQGVLDVHLCMTGGRSGMTALALELAREVFRESGRSDIVTGLRSKTHMGQPAWESLLGEIAQRHEPNPVDVYYCGPPGLAARLRPLCRKLGMRFREEQF